MCPQDRLRQAQGERGITILWRAQGEQTPLPRTSGYRLFAGKTGGALRRAQGGWGARVPLRRGPRLWRGGRFAHRPYGPSPNSLWIPAFAGKTGGGLVDGDAFGQVAGAVYGAAFGQGAVVGHELEGDGAYDGREHRVCGG